MHKIQELNYRLGLGCAVAALVAIIALVAAGMTAMYGLNGPMVAGCALAGVLAGATTGLTVKPKPLQGREIGRLMAVFVLTSIAAAGVGLAIAGLHSLGH